MVCNSTKGTQIPFGLWADTERRKTGIPQINSSWCLLSATAHALGDEVGGLLAHPRSHCQQTKPQSRSSVNAGKGPHTDLQADFQTFVWHQVDAALHHVRGYLDLHWQWWRHTGISVVLIHFGRVWLLLWKKSVTGGSVLREMPHPNLISHLQIRSKTYKGKCLGTDPKETMYNLGQAMSQDIHQSITCNS